MNSTRTLWFGRDAFGRRSLLVHWPTAEDPRLLLSSVAPTLVEHSSDMQFENGVNQQKYWEELTCGIYSMKIDASILNGRLVGEIKSHEWNNSMVKELIHWERTYVEPTAEELFLSRGSGKASPSVLAEKVLTALRESVLRRTSHKFFQLTLICLTLALMVLLLRIESLQEQERRSWEELLPREGGDL